MTLVRAFSRVDEQGRITIPTNIRLQASLKAGQLVEIKSIGAGKVKGLLISPKENFR